MQLTTILLIPSDNFNWVGLRATLADWPEVRVVADVQRREPAVRVAAHEQPDLILTQDVSSTATAGQAKGGPGCRIM